MDCGIGEASDLVVDNGFGLGFSCLCLSVSLTVLSPRTFSCLLGVAAPLAGAGVDSARCSCPGRNLGLVESNVLWPDVSMVRLRRRL
jgi:hypothetical protein